MAAATCTRLFGLLLVGVAACLPVAYAQAQSLNPPPPPDAKCRATANGTLCEFDYANEGENVPSWNGVACDGFTINNTYQSQGHIKQTFDAAGELTKEIRHTAFSGTLTNSSDASKSLPYEGRFVRTMDVAAQTLTVTGLNTKVVAPKVGLVYLNAGHTILDLTKPEGENVILAAGRWDTDKNTQPLCDALSSTISSTPTVTQESAEVPFTTSHFKLPMNFTLGTDWYVLEDYSDVVTFRHKLKRTELSFNLVNAAKVTDPVDPAGKRVPFPEDFISWLQADPDFVTAAPVAVTIAGYPGTQIDATSIWTSSTAYKKPFLHLASTGWNLVTDPEKWRFIMLDDVNGERMLIMQIALLDDFELATELGQEIIKTMTVAPAAK